MNLVLNFELNRSLSNNNNDNKIPKAHLHTEEIKALLMNQFELELNFIFVKSVKPLDQNII